MKNIIIMCILLLLFFGCTSKDKSLTNFEINDNFYQMKSVEEVENFFMDDSASNCINISNIFIDNYSSGKVIHTNTAGGDKQLAVSFNSDISFDISAEQCENLSIWFNSTRTTIALDCEDSTPNVGNGIQCWLDFENSNLDYIFVNNQSLSSIHHHYSFEHFSDLIKLQNAIINKNSEYCEEAYKDYCNSNIAHLYNESEYCEKIISDMSHDNCLKEFLNNESMCYKLRRNSSKNSCLYDFRYPIALENNDSTFCLSDIVSNHEICYLEFAIDTKNPAICSNINDSFYHNSCIRKSVSKLEHLSYCDAIPSSSNQRNLCYRNLAIETQNISICENIDSDYLYEECIELD